MAGALGLPVRDDSATGTSILIPWPEADAEPIRGRTLVEILLCHLWPKMVSPDGPRAMRFRVEDEGRMVPIPRVASHPVYSLFASALLAARDRTGASGAREIRLQKPDIVTGHLALEVGAERQEADAGKETPEAARFRSPVEDGAHHVALMRPSERVVRYLEVLNARADRSAWAGVFLCAADMDVQNAFARSEPPRARRLDTGSSGRQAGAAPRQPDGQPPHTFRGTRGVRDRTPSRRDGHRQHISRCCVGQILEGFSHG